MGKSYKQTRISLKYNDSSLEEEFLRAFHPKIITFARNYMIVSQLVASFYFGHSFYRAISNNSLNKDRLKI
jgi:hypothetical protein